MTGTLVALVGLAAATLLSEDAAGLAAGLAAATGTVPVWGAVAAIGAGIWIGDVGLWAVGRLSGRLVTRLTTWRGIAPADLDAARARLRRHAPAAIIGSRFLPGTRLAVYLGAGASGVGFLPFAAWAAVGVALWAPLLVLTSMALGTAIVTPGVYSIAAAAGLIVAALLLWRRHLARALGLQLARLSRWEFWPSWLFYAPVVPWVGLLMLSRGARALAAANPGLEDGGFVGESKARILSVLPKAWTLPHVLVPGGASPVERVALLRAAIASNGWTYPIILKPDVGQRGTGVRLTRSEEAALAYFTEQPAATIAQVYHPGPYEAGIFYYRLPCEAHGQIFSVTDKHFPVVVGDGTATLEALITGHHRYRLQARMFLERHRSQLARVPRPGEPVRLGIAGNHAQGTLMLDGADLITETLVARIDEIAQSIDGFFIGRFDVRYRDPRGFMAGTDLAIVELNGVTAEATHIYDPSWSLFRAYRTLYKQWWLVFAIGAANVRLGRSTTSLGRLARLSLSHLWSRAPRLLAD